MHTLDLSEKSVVLEALLFVLVAWVEKSSCDACSELLFGITVSSCCSGVECIGEFACI